MICSAVLLGLALVAAEDEPLARGQIHVLLQQLRAPLHDYECLYEGQDKRLKEPDLTGLPDPIRKATERNPAWHAGAVITYQGSYAYRSDKSLHIDVSIRKPDPSEPLRREILCLFRDRAAKRIIVPDQGGVTGPDLIRRDGTVFVKKTYSLLRVDMLPYLMEKLSIGEIDCVSPGWEDVDGHRCLVIDFPGMDDKKEKRVWGERFWADVSRGGCVLKYEWEENGLVTARLTGVELSQEPASDGATIWLPIAGKLVGYRVGFRTFSEAQSEQTYYILRGTLKINTNLPDSRFDMDYGVDAQMRADATAVNRGREPKRARLPNDSVTSLKRVLRDTEDPSKRLVAAPASSESWLRRNLGATTFLVGGGTALLVSLILVRRSR